MTTPDPTEAGAGRRSRRLLLVRHGQTPSNVAGALDTRIPGAPLTELGREQAATAGELIATEQFEPTVVFSSEAARARETSRIIADRLGVGAEPVPDSMEIQAGEYEMRTDADALLAYNQVMRDWLEKGEMDSRLPGGESALDIRRRFLPIVDSFRESYLDSDPGSDAIIVVHGALMRLATVLLGAVRAHYALDNRIPNCGIIELESLGNDWICHRWADLQFSVR